MSPLGLPPTPFVPGSPVPDAQAPRRALPHILKNEVVANWRTVLENKKSQYPEDELRKFLVQQLIDGIEKESLSPPVTGNLDAITYSRWSDVFPPTGQRYPIKATFERDPQGKLVPLQAQMTVEIQDRPEKIQVSFREDGTPRSAASGSGAKARPVSPSAIMERGTAKRLRSNAEMALALMNSTESPPQSGAAQSTAESATGNPSSQAAHVAPESDAGTRENRRETIAVSAETQNMEDRAAPATLSSTLTRPISTAIIKHVQENFAEKLRALLMIDNLSPLDKKNNTYRLVWILEIEKRFFAALIQTAYDACKAASFDVTPSNAHEVLGKAVSALKGIRGGKKARLINETLLTAHGMTKDRRPALTFSMAKQKLRAEFTALSDVNEIFQRVTSRITVIDPNSQIVPTLMWKHCVSPSMLDTLQELGVDNDNPLLPYIDDTKDKASLLNMANAWDYITQQANQETTPESLKNLLLKLWAICSGDSTPSDNKSIAIPEVNNNYAVLMEDAENTPLATMTDAGSTELAHWLDMLQTDFEVTVKWGDDDDDEDSEEYPRNVITLSRDDTPSENLMKLLEYISKTCVGQMAEANGDEDKLLAAQAKLAMALTQSRLFPGENINVGMKAINLFRLQHRQPVPFTLPNADIFDGHSLSEVVDKMKSIEGRT